MVYHYVVLNGYGILSEELNRFVVFDIALFTCIVIRTVINSLYFQSIQ